MRLPLITLAILGLLIAGCNPQTKVSNQKDSTNVAEHHDEETTVIELNNGEKWTVDAEMMVHIRNMEKDVSDYATGGNSDYKSIAKKLQTNIELLTSNCAMTGKAHDELHKWLLPYIDTVDEFAKLNDTTSAAGQFKTIQSSFTTFNTYFQ
jgi:hypothetical protein